MAEPTVPVREMVDLIVDQWNRGLEAHEALRLLLPLTYRVLNAEPTTAATMIAPYSMGSHDAPYEQGEEVWARTLGGQLRQWVLDQAGDWIEAEPEPEPAPVVQQAWHGDDTTPAQALAEPVNEWGLTVQQTKENQHRAVDLVEAGAISPEQVGSVVRGQHPRSPHHSPTWLAPNA